MEKPEIIPQAASVELPMTPVAAAEGLPWTPARSAPGPRLERPVETVHWTIAALTILTALGVLFGAYGRTPSAPRELLPIVIDLR